MLLSSQSSQPYRILQYDWNSFVNNAWFQFTEETKNVNWNVYIGLREAIAIKAIHLKVISSLEKAKFAESLLPSLK